MRVQVLLLGATSTDSELEPGLSQPQLCKILDPLLGRPFFLLLSSATSSLYGTYLMGTILNATESLNPHKVMK